MLFLKLIRIPNIIIIAITQIAIYFSIIIPTLNSYSIENSIPLSVILGMIFATCLIAAGGYIINDYFDIKIDRINNPDQMIITNGIEKRIAMNMYQSVTGLGIMIGIVIAFILKSMTIGFIFVVVPGMLWFYSASYKRQLIIGNLIIGVSIALTILLPLIAQSANLSNKYGDLIHHTPVLSQLYSIVCGFAFFAFLFTIIREIIKDIADEVGDREMECHTIPIVWGITNAKIIVSVLTIISVSLLMYCAYYFLSFNMESNLSVKYFTFATLAPSICMLVLLWGKSCKAYTNASNMVKFILILGVAYTIIYQFLLAKIYGIAFFGVFNVI